MTEAAPTTPTTDAPRKRWRDSPWWNLTGLLSPFFGGWKNLGIYFGSWLVVLPAMGAAVFPSAEKAVADEGLNPKIVAELAPNKRIVVRTDNFLGRMDVLLSSGPLAMYWAWKYNFSAEAPGGYAEVNANAYKLLGFCQIYLRKSTFRGPKEDYQHALLHEIRHCGDDNQRLAFAGGRDNVQVEGDADAKAAEVLARETGRPELKHYFLMERAANGRPRDAIHDTSLYLSAVFNGEKPPSAAAIDAANKEALPTYAPLAMHEINTRINARDLALGRKKSICDVDADTRFSCSYSLAAQKLSPLAMKRAQLFDEAARESAETVLKTYNGPAWGT